jgi:Ca2+-transporting ATPase
VIKARLKRYGQNILAAIGGRSHLEMFLEQFQSLPVVLLIGASALSLLTGAIADAIVVMSVVILNAGIGYATESKAERTISALSKPLGHPVPIIREGKREFIPVELTVPGDLIELRPGVVVAADARVVDARGLTMNEALLTGESTLFSRRRTR